MKILRNYYSKRKYWIFQYRSLSAVFGTLRPALARYGPPGLKPPARPAFRPGPLTPLMLTYGILQVATCDANVIKPWSLRESATTLLYVNRQQHSYHISDLSIDLQIPFTNTHWLHTVYYRFAYILYLYSTESFTKYLKTNLIIRTSTHSGE